jgi:peptide/nickel transport system substrate-binding protein
MMAMISTIARAAGSGLALALGLLIGIGTAPATASSPPGTMTWALHVTVAPQWFDPAETAALATPYMVLYAVHDALVKPMPGNPHAPSLAESWTVSRDGLTWDFVLRKGATFHNGDPVTAEDVKFSYERYKGAGAKAYRDKVAAVEVLDAQRVRFRLKEPWPDFLTFYGTSATGAGWIAPKKYVERVGADGFKTAPVGAGPYRVASMKPGVEIVLEAFDAYWRKPPAVKRIVLRSMPEEATRFAALRAGDVDLAFNLRGAIAESVKRTPGLRLDAEVVDSVFWLDLPDQWDPRSPWHDRRVRLAANLALDRQALNQADFLGLARPTGSIIPRNFEFALAVEPPPFHQARARQLLAEAGYPNGFDAGDFYPFPSLESSGEAMASYLQAVGIRTRVRLLERAAFIQSWREKKLRGIVMGTTAAAGNAATRLEAFVTQGGAYAYGVVPEIEDLFQRQSREVDRPKREALLVKIQEMVRDRIMQVPVYEYPIFYGVGPRVEVSGVGLIKGWVYPAPFEDLKLKNP